MSEGMHTPGPWHLVNGTQIRSAKHQIAKVWMMRGSEGVANARLIAAAPELLEALQDLKRELILSNVDPDYIESHFRKSINKAEAAIAKASGDRLGEMAAIDRIAKAAGQPA